MHRRTVWTECSIQEYPGETGRPPVLVRWVVTNEGDETNPGVRPRLVAKHIVAKYGGKGMGDMFAAMPSFEFSKMFVRLVCAETPREFQDSSKSHVH